MPIWATKPACIGCNRVTNRVIRSRCLSCYRRALTLGIIRAVRPGCGGRKPAAGTMCVACGKYGGSRPRRLCWRCCADPAVRAKYLPRDPEFAPGEAAEVADAFRFPPPVRDRDVPPPPQAAPARDWDRWPGLGRADDGLDLDPSTLPAAIARDQRTAVREALAELGPGAAVEVLSAAVVLPVDVVRRRVEEINRGEP